MDSSFIENFDAEMIDTTIDETCEEFNDCDVHDDIDSDEPESEEHPEDDTLMYFFNMNFSVPIEYIIPDDERIINLQIGSLIFLLLQKIGILHIDDHINVSKLHLTQEVPDFNSEDNKKNFEKCKKQWKEYEHKYNKKVVELCNKFMIIANQFKDAKYSENEDVRLIEQQMINCILGGCYGSKYPRLFEIENKNKNNPRTISPGIRAKNAGVGIILETIYHKLDEQDFDEDFKNALKKQIADRNLDIKFPTKRSPRGSLISSSHALNSDVITRVLKIVKFLKFNKDDLIKEIFHIGTVLEKQRFRGEKKYKGQQTKSSIPTGSVLTGSARITRPKLVRRPDATQKVTKPPKKQSIGSNFVLIPVKKGETLPDKTFFKYVDGVLHRIVQK